MSAARFSALFLWMVASAALCGEEVVTPRKTMELFNGRDFTGWRFCPPGASDPGKTWSVADGRIHCVGKPTGFLRTEKTYANYELTVEWRFVKVSKGADNTGILVHMQAPDKVWPPCVQVQGKTGRQGDVFLMAGAEAAEHRGMDANTPLPFHGTSREMPVGDWNTIRVICAGDSVKAFVNGTLENEITACTLHSGGIGIQSEGAEIEIRRIAVGPLP